MLLLLRRIKHLRFMSNDFRKYLSYAVGEMLLVVLGILIALQIDNWNEDRQQRKLLDSYLQGIARNMRDDAEELASLKAERLKQVNDAFMAFNFTTGGRRQTFDVYEIYFFRNIMNEARYNLYFHAEASSFEALKNSGVIERLQGQGTERLLSAYYDQVRRIEKLESWQNEAVNQLTLQVSTSIPHDVEVWAFEDPRALSPARFAELQPVYAQVINASDVREMLSYLIAGTGVVREYNRLMEIGAAFERRVAGGARSLDDAGLEALLDADTATPRPVADLVTDGRLVAEYYYFAAAAADFAPVFDLRSIQREGDSLHFEYPGSDSWAAIYLGYLGAGAARPSQDFSQFDTLVLELKGDLGDETVTVQIKDSELNDWEPPDSVELRVTDEWQTYEIDLASFPRTDLRILMQPLGFSFDREPQSFSLRTARYVSAGQAPRP